jgi:uncharacterized protein related to proFAR isomerase
MIDFIFMLTREDRTIEDCLDTFDAIAGVGLRHVGFKDIGVTRETLEELNRRIKASGATSYMEVVSTTPEACLASAAAAVEIGVDRLLGGTDIAAIQEVIAGNAIEFMPFPGRPVGHPTDLEGSPEDVAADCRRFTAFGCAGADLLAYRATEADPLELVRAARRALEGYLVVAGSVASPERIDELVRAGADAFTIGTAVFDGSFSPRKGLITSQLRDILVAAGG